MFCVVVAGLPADILILEVEPELSDSYLTSQMFDLAHFLKEKKKSKLRERTCVIVGQTHCSVNTGYVNFNV